MCMNAYNFMHDTHSVKILTHLREQSPSSSVHLPLLRHVMVIDEFVVGKKPW